jgi:hypothetical protein
LEYDWKKGGVQLLKGDVVIPIEVPKDCEIRWLNVGGCLNSWNGSAGAKTPNAICFSSGTPDNWKGIYDCSSLPDWKNHWHHNADVVQVLETPAQKVFVKYACKSGLNAVRIEAHYSSANVVAKATPVIVTHAFAEKDKGEDAAQIVTRSFDGPSSYEIEGPQNATNIFVRYEVPSLDQKGNVLK